MTDEDNQRDIDRIRRRREALENQLPDQSAEISLIRSDETGSPVQRVQRTHRVRGVLAFVGFVVGTILLAQIAATIGASSGYDYADARRTGLATVNSCERR